MAAVHNNSSTSVVEKSQQLMNNLCHSHGDGLITAGSADHLETHNSHHHQRCHGNQECPNDDDGGGGGGGSGDGDTFVDAEDGNLNELNCDSTVSTSSETATFSTNPTTSCSTTERTVGGTGGSSTSAASGPTKDSGIDMTSSFQNDQDEEIVDLELIEMADDDGSWLYTVPGVKKTKEDTIAWLRKDIDKLDLRTRRTLVTKLEQLLRNNSNTPENVKNSQILAENVEKEKENHGYGKTYKVKKQSAQVQSASPGRKISCPDNVKSDNRQISDDFVLKSSFPFQQSAGDSADINQIRLLACRQEQDLRNCLQQTQLSQQARRKISSEQFIQDENLFVPISKQLSPAANQFQNAQPQFAHKPAPTTPLFRPPPDFNIRGAPPQNGGEGCVDYPLDARQHPLGPARQPPAASHSATYTKQRQAKQQPPCPIPVDSNNTATPARLKNGPLDLHKKHSFPYPMGEQQQQSMPPHSLAAALMGAQKDNGLQKSMPNLADGQLNRDLSNDMSASISEKGSYGNIASNNYGIVPSASSHAVSSSLPRAQSGGSRLPTPRSKLPKPSSARLDSATKLAVPSSITKSTVPTASNTPKASFFPKSPLPMNESWKEGCI